MQVRLRQVHLDDEGRYRRSRRSSGVDEPARTDWSREQVERYLSARFEAGCHYCNEQFPNSELQVVVLNDKPIGRIYVGWWADDVRLIDIALLPEYRNRGIGAALVEGVMDAARRAGMPVRLHVDKSNPVHRLYERLGFQVIGDRGINYFMEWRSDW